MYINVHSYYSFKYGILSPELLVDLASQYGYERVVLTDINSTSGVFGFYHYAQKKKLIPVVGIDFRNGTDQLFIAIAVNGDGFEEVNDYLSYYLHSEEKIPARAPLWRMVKVVYPFKKAPDLSSLCENEYIGISLDDLKSLKVRDFVERNPSKCVALSSGTFLTKNHFNTHRLLRAIDQNVLLSKLSSNEVGNETDLIYPPQELHKLYGEYSFLVKNAERLINDCQFDLMTRTGQTNNKRTYLDSREEDQQLIRKLCNEGLNKRYKEVSEEVKERLEKELLLISEKDFVSYFLINWDLIQYARSKGYYYVGRGSGANSIVAYLLFITDVDPIDLDLYFERFINMYRVSPPDFDIDFSWADREDITSYLFNKYDNVALLGTHVTFQLKGAIREIGKVLGVPAHEIDEISDERSILDERQQLVKRYAERIYGMPHYLGIHAAGILISEKSIHRYTATSLPPKGYQTTHFDMKYAEDVGLHKFDILSQRGLGKIKDALALVKAKYPDADFDLRDMEMLKKDEGIKHLLRKGKTIGCFYVESPAMRMLLSKLEVDDYLGLVAASSIIRPGVAKSGMMREYILRHKNPSRRNQGHPKLLEIMPETYGIMVYQEDVIKVAHYFAGLSLGEADVLRRGMSGKFRSRAEFQQVKDQFYSNCDERGYNRKDTNEIWRQIESFAGYAFAKGHSASYAVESYQSLYLKAYYPLEYMVAILNNGGGFYRQELYIHEARMQGAEIEAPCINRSSSSFLLIGNTIFLSFFTISEMREDVVLDIVEERERRGEFKSFEDFIDRVPISLEQVVLLIRINAFRLFEVPRKALLWKAHFMLNKQKKSITNSLFKEPVKEYYIPELDENKDELTFEQIDLLGFPLTSPFQLLEDSVKTNLVQNDLKERVNKRVVIAGYMIAIKKTNTSSGNKMSFGTFIDQSGAFLDTVHFPPVLKRYPFMGSGVYEIEGKVVEEFGFVSIEVNSMRKLNYRKDSRFTD